MCDPGLMRDSLAGLSRTAHSIQGRALMGRPFGLRNTAAVVGAAFLLSGVIKLTVRGTLDVDLIVGAVFLVVGLVVWLAGRGSSQ